MKKVLAGNTEFMQNISEYLENDFLKKILGKYCNFIKNAQEVQYVYIR